MFSMKTKIFSVFCILIFCFSAITAYFSGVVKPILYLQSEAYLKTVITSTVANSLENSTLDSFFEDTFCFNYNSDGSIAAFSSNMLNVNKIRSFLSKDIINKIKAIKTHTVIISAGTLSGIPFLYGKGRKFSINISPLFGITCDISSEFSDAGINQTIHKLKLNITAESALKENFTNKKITVTTSVPISETVILGDIPEAYTLIIRAHEEDEEDINDYAATVD